jgi:hypothetical protein
MPDFSDAVIREQLASAGVIGDVTIRYVDRVRDDIDARGHPFTARKSLLQNWTRRLRNARMYAPDDKKWQAHCESRVTALEATAPDEPIYSWGVKTSAGHYYSGISTALRIILIDCTDELHDPIT